MVTLSPNETTVYESEVKVCNFNLVTSTFIKREKPGQRNPVTERWLSERFSNEATVLQLIRQHTDIPVPRFLSYGRDQNGHLYLETDLMVGTVRCDAAGNECRMPHFHGHQAGPCNRCSTIAMNNANNFIANRVLPQLERLRNTKMGLNGVVIPPKWVMEHDKRQSWPTRQSAAAEFIFCHLDLTSHNILLDAQSLEVRALIDWEESGFFPPELQQWAYSRDEYFDLYEDRGMVEQHISLLTS